MTLPTAYPPQVSFPGQAAAPEGPSDLMPMYLMHHAFRRDLRDFLAAAERTPVADRRTWARLAGRWQRFSRVLHLHHSGEDDVLWPLLLDRVDRAGDAEARAVLEAMEAEHDEIDPLLAACEAGLRRLAEGGDDDARAALVVRLAAAGERLGAHLGHEETDAMALVQRYLTPEEWEGMHVRFGEHYTAADSLFSLPWLMPELPDEVKPAVHGFLGRPVALAERVLLRPGFRRRERRTFRYSAAAGSAASGGTARGLLVTAFGALLAADLVGGLVDIAAGRTTPATAWGPDATLCAPWPMIAFQAVAVAVIARGGRRSAGVASVLLGLACGVSVASGFLDGQLGRAGLTGGEVAFQAALLAITGLVGIAGLVAARQKP